jgi:hypothetical protein
MLKTKLSTAWQLYGIYMHLQPLHIRWQHCADQQECVFMAERVKLNVIAKGEDYSHVWSEVRY